jgi:hypothetical protein
MVRSHTWEVVRAVALALALVWSGLLQGQGVVNSGARSTVAISEPATGGTVGLQTTVRGAASALGSDHVWLLVRMTDFAPLWWPQREAAVDPTTGQFKGKVVFGGPQDVGSEFDVAAITVDALGHAVLMEYWKKAMSTGDWKPIEIPKPTSPPAIVTVKKTKH